MLAHVIRFLIKSQKKKFNELICTLAMPKLKPTQSSLNGFLMEVATLFLLESSL